MREPRSILPLIALIAVSFILIISGLHFFVYEPALERLEGALGEQQALLQELVEGLDALQERFGLLEEKVESLEDEVIGLKPVAIVVEYSGISHNMTFALVLDREHIAEQPLEIHYPRFGVEVMHLGEWSGARWQNHVISVALDGEHVLDSRFFLGGEGCLVVTVWDTGARLDLHDECPLFL
ncbi:MAG: hypothetical protein ACE5KH_01370 [Candidatus Geothermarchaeales archaeon]